MAYTLTPVASEGINSMTLQIDGQTLTYTGAPSSKAFNWPGATHGVHGTLKFGGVDLGWANYEGLWSVFHFFDEAERWQPAANGYNLEWIVRTGKNPMTLPSGKPLTVRFDLNLNGAPPIMQKGYMSRMGCVAEVAK